MLFEFLAALASPGTIQIRVGAHIGLCDLELLIQEDEVETMLAERGFSPIFSPSRQIMTFNYDAEEARQLLGWGWMWESAQPYTHSVRVQDWDFSEEEIMDAASEWAEFTAHLNSVCLERAPLGGMPLRDGQMLVSSHYFENNEAWLAVLPDEIALTVPGRGSVTFRNAAVNYVADDGAATYSFASSLSSVMLRFQTELLKQQRMLRACVQAWRNRPELILRRNHVEDGMFTWADDNHTWAGKRYPGHRTIYMARGNQEWLLKEEFYDVADIAISAVVYETHMEAFRIHKADLSAVHYTAHSSGSGGLCTGDADVEHDGSVDSIKEVLDGVARALKVINMSSLNSYGHMHDNRPAKRAIRAFNRAWSNGIPIEEMPVFERRRNES